MAKIETKTLGPDLANCPHCGVDLRNGGDGVYSRIVGIYSMERDMTVAWKCPDCGKEDPR